jgi:hypothetical protein
MRSARLAFSVIVLVLLAAGYLASQYFWFSGDPQRWTTMIDTPPIVMLSLLILLGAIALAFVKEKT